METQTTHQVKLYKLLLNDMRSPKIEYLDIAAVSFDRDGLIDYYESQKESWRDGNWSKSFKSGSILEWFNDMGLYGGIEEQWIDEDLIEQVKSEPFYIQSKEETTND